MADYTIKARPTIYKGIQMRSRLEAHYAQHLDAIGEKWAYEPRCFATDTGQYLPDFEIGDHNYFEVKPYHVDHDAALKRMHVILDSDPDAYLTVVTTNGDDMKSWGWAARCSPWHGESGCRCGRKRRVRPGEHPFDGTMLNTDNPYECTILRCPSCWQQYTHLEEVKPYQGGTDSNRLAVCPEFSCECCGARFLVDMINHKGDTQIRCHIL